MGIRVKRAYDDPAEGDGYRVLVDRVRAGRITLVYGARDPEHNNAVALREYLKRYV